MIVLERTFGVSKYFIDLYNDKQIEPEERNDPRMKGLVAPIEIKIPGTGNDCWLDADAFFDDGCDETVLSLRWLCQKCAEETWPNLPPIGTNPKDLSSFRRIMAPVSFRLSGRIYNFASGEERLLVRPQKMNLRNRGSSGLQDLENKYKSWVMPYVDTFCGDMDLPGFEDILIGRDFLRMHNMLKVVDHQTDQFYLIDPCNKSNRRLRRKIRRSLTRYRTT